MALGPRSATAVVVALLVIVNLLNNRLAPAAYVTTCLVAAAALLLVMRAGGGTWADAGLGRETLGRGARWGAVLIAIVAAGCLIAALLPATREVFLDRRVANDTTGDLAYQVLVRIPLGTVLLEEVAFRGVLYGLLIRQRGVAWATAISSTLFGLWHILPALGLLRLNPFVDRAFAGEVWLTVLAGVAATAVAGVVLCELRRRSGSLLPCLALHWATNALGYLTAFIVVHTR